LFRPYCVWVYSAYEGICQLNSRHKVTIRCNHCNEKFILRGRKDQGRVETGFKQCLCSNAEDFEIEEEALI